AVLCPELAWSLPPLRDGDRARGGAAFKSAGIPSCIKPLMHPMLAPGDYIPRRGRHSYSGLADGPLLVVDALKLADAERDKMLHSVFIDNPAGLAKLSAGHKALAQSMAPKFAPLEKYYLGVHSKWGPT